MGIDTKTKKDGKAKKLWLTVLAIFLAVLLLGGLAYNICDTNGVFLRSTKSVTSANYTVTNAMLSYYYHYDYNTFVSQNSSYLSYYGLDTSLPLKSQYYGGSTTTWYEYFMQSAINDAQQALYLCEAARAAGLKLDDEDYKDIDAALDSMKTMAKAYGIGYGTYIAQMYGNGVKEKDVRACLELSALASKQYDAMKESYKYTEDDWEKYCDENKADFYTADYMSYTFKATFAATGATDEDIAKAKEDAKKLADELATKTTSDDFFKYIAEYTKSTTTTESSTTTTTEKTAKDYTTTGHAFGETSDLDKWLFADGRKAGETTVISSEDTDKNTYTYTAYLVIEPSSRAEYQMVNVRHILIGITSSSTDEEKAEAKKKAEELLATFNAGDKTADAFAKLATENSTDTGSSANGGLYEDVSKGDMVTAFDDWCFADDRKAGDTGVVETDYGYHVMYLDSFGETKWKYDANEALKNDAYTEEYKTYATTYPVNVDYKAAAKVG